MSLRRALIVQLIGLSLAFSATVRADLELPDLPPAADSLHLRTGKIVLEPAQSLHRLDISAPGATLTETGHYVIQIDGPLTPARESALHDAGVKLGQYLPMYAYIVELPSGFNVPAQLDGMDFVRWIGAYETDWKLDPNIGNLQHTVPDRVELANQERLRLVVSLFGNADLDAALDQINAFPAVVINDTSERVSGSVIELDMPSFAFPLLAEIEQVQFVDEVGDYKFRNDTNKWIAQTNVNGSTTVWNNGLHGEGQIGGLIDGAVRQTHCSFSDPSGNPIGPLHRKFAAYIGASGQDSHGTHVAGSFVGDEFPVNGTTTYRGIAYLGKLVANRTSVTTANVNTLLTQDHNSGARVHSNSWGWDGSQTYIQPSADVDTFSRTNEDSLVLVAVTNVNAVIYQPENAKNCIGVALLNDTPNQETQCFSVGFSPCNDGRRKPELLAPGCSTWSSNSSTTCSFTNSGFSGTSMATPLISGCGLLARQYYMSGYYPTGAAVGGDAFTPTGALIKATLMNSGRDVTGFADFPSVREGWGRVTLDDALYFPGDARKLMLLDDIRHVNGLTTGQSKVYNVNVTAGMSMKVTLVWTEPAAAVNANPAYINNLNLTVTGPGGTYLGNVFSGGQSTTGGSADFRNNVEQVYLTAPAAGTYTITVNALAVNAGGPQGFAALVTGNVAPVPAQPDCDQSGGFDLSLDTACFVDVLLGINNNGPSETAVDMDNNTINDGRDISLWIDCVVNNVCN